MLADGFALMLICRWRSRQRRRAAQRETSGCTCTWSTSEQAETSCYSCSSFHSMLSLMWVNSPSIYYFPVSLKLMNVQINYHQYFTLLHFLICLLSFLDHICSAGLVACLLVRQSRLFIFFYTLLRKHVMVFFFVLLFYCPAQYSEVQ